MLFATFQNHDYLSKAQGKWREDIKSILGIPFDKNIYWCIPANSFEQFVLYAHSIEPNMSKLFVLFETDDFYRIDGIKWNQYVEDASRFPLSQDILKIDYPNYSEYIVTDIPEKRVELDCNIADLVENAVENKYNSISQKAASIIYNNIRQNPRIEQSLKYDRQTMGSVVVGATKEMAEARASYGEVLRYFLGMFYNIGLYALTGEKRTPKSLVISGQKYIDINKRKNEIFTKYADADKMYAEYNSFFRYLYNLYFPTPKPSEKIYPNAFCPCGSGKKYKKCCMNKSNISIDEIMQSGF